MWFSAYRAAGLRRWRAVLIAALVIVGPLAAAPAAASAPRKPVNTSLPTITGAPEERQTLTASPGTWSSASTVTYAYQWRRCSSSGSSCVDIAGATASTYQLVAADVGRTLRVKVTARNAGGATSATSSQTAVVRSAPPPPAPPVNVSPPTIAGTAAEGRTLTAGEGSWTGSAPMSFTYQWRRCDPAGNACVDLAGATSKTYTLVAGDVGATVRVVVRASNPEGDASAASAQTAIVMAAPPGSDVVVTAAGDIAASPTDSAGTAAIIEQIAPNRALTLGDNAYTSGTLTDYLNNYDPNWGRFRATTSPVPGNHEYETPGAAGYFQYFGSQVPAEYYSFDLGAWHLIALNSEIDMSSTSPQFQWLQNDLAANAGRCILAYWHRPRWSSGTVHGSSTSLDRFWRTLYAVGADVVLNGHEHNYERFAPQNPDGGADVNGIREFVVGTGGASLYSLGTPIANSEVRGSTSDGVLKLTLHPDSYDWQFVPVAGGTFTDSGSDSCQRTNDTTAPSAPANLTATASGGGIRLAWTASTDNTGIVGYDVFRDNVLLERVTGTTFNDAAVTPQTTYSYVVKARDAAGNVSDASNTATATAATVTTMTLAPDADSAVSESSPTANAGSSKSLRVDGGTGVHVESDLRFTVPAGSAQIGRATLRVYAYSDTANGPSAFGASNLWTELGVTWGSRPSRTSGAVDDKGAIAANSWAEWDVSGLVTGPGTYSFTLAGESTDGVDMYSREAADLRPQLVVTYG
jgi:hypothetical protein